MMSTSYCNLLASVSILCTTFFSLSCHKAKETTLNFVVKDSVAKFRLNYVSIKISHYNKKGIPNYDYRNTGNDGDGAAEYVYDEGGRIASIEFSNDGYVTDNTTFDAYIPTIKEGEMNEIEIPLVPKNGKLTLNIINETGTISYLNVLMKDQTMFKKNGQVTQLDQYPLYQLKGSTYTQTFDIPTPQYCYIYWSALGNPLAPDSGALVDSVFVHTFMSRTYTITY